MKAQLLFRCHFKGETLSSRYDRETSTYIPKKSGTAKLGAVTAHDAEQAAPEMKAEIERFYEATPAGSLEFQTINEEAAAMFEPGGLYKVIIERVD